MEVLNIPYFQKKKFPSNLTCQGSKNQRKIVQNNGGNKRKEIIILFEFQIYSFRQSQKI